ncbi:MAG: HK97 family phage prohead protease [Alphaproteobacteria bacterium]|nr:HK97 family phage prohead protease [Alphaproteobacteria bacterium]
MKTKYMTALFEVKELGSEGFIAGYASVFGEVDAQSDVVAKGAFTRSLSRYKQSKSNPAMLWMHDTGEPIGVWTSVNEDARGLRVEGKLAVKTQHGAEAYELLKIGAVSGLSIGYSAIKSVKDSKTKIRTLTEVELYEISLVTFPANSLARVHTVKEHTDNQLNHNEFQAIVMRLRNTANALKN